MRPPSFALTLLGAAALLAGCADIGRSRNLANADVAGRTIALQVCSNCHGATGSSVSPNFPNLAGQTEPYLTAQLTAFRGRQRQDPAGFEYMWGLSRHLSDAQIASLASYFSAQKPVAQSPEGEADRLPRGDAIFHGSLAAQGVPACASCHGNDAQGQANFPRLAGQHADYIAKQLAVFQRTEDRPEGAVMKTVAHSLTEQNIADVAAYLQSIQPR